MKVSSCLFNSLLLSAGVGLLAPLAQAGDVVEEVKPASLEPVSYTHLRAHET